MASTTTTGFGGQAFTATSEKSIAPVSDVTAEDLRELRQGSQSSVDTLQSQPPPMDMSGDNFRHMESTRYDGVMRGYYAQPDGDLTQAAPPNLAPLPQDQPAYAPPVEPDWQQRYGQSENEKGEWRRLAETLSEQVQSVNAQLAELRQAQMTQANAIQQQYVQPQPPGPPPRIFPEKSPNELLNYGELESIIWNEILPTIAQRDAMTVQQAQDAAAASTQRILPTWDVSAQEESAALGQLRSSYQGFDSRFSQTERNRMIQDKVSILRQSRSGNGFTPMPPTATPITQARPQAPILVDPTRAMRRATYVESAPPTQMSREPSNPMSPVDSFRAEWAAMDEAARATGKPRASAADMKRLLMKYGVQEVNDWNGGPGTLSR